MTVEAKGRSRTSACDGVTKLFAVPFQFIANGDLSVILLDASTDANEAGTLLSEGADYAISGNGRAGTASITTTIAYPAGKYIRRWRDTSRAQDSDYQANDGFPAEAHEQQLDRLSLVDEEIDEQFTRTARVPAGEAGVELPGRTTRAGKYLAFGAGGEPVASVGTGNDAALRTDLAAATGGALVGVKQAGVGAVTRSTSAKVGETLSVFDYGNGGDGVIDDSVALQKALNRGGAIFMPRPSVRYNFQTPLTVTQPGTTLYGFGSPEFYVDTDNQPLFTVQASNFTFDGFRLLGDPALAAAIFRIATSGGALEQIRIRDVFGDNLYHFYEDNGGTALFGAYLDTIKLNQHRGFGVNTTKHFGYFYIDKFGVSRVGLSGAPYNFAGIRVDGAEGVFINECGVDGTNSTSIQTSQHGFHLTNCSFASIENSVPDHVGGNGVLAVNCGTVEIDGVDVPNVNLSAIKATDCIGLRIDGGVFGSFATGNAAACGLEATTCTSIIIPSAHASGMKSDGFRLTSCGDVTFGLPIARACGGKGFNLNGTNNVTAAAVQSIGNAQEGFYTIGCNGVTTTGMITRSNTGRGIVSAAGDIAVHHLGARMNTNTAGSYSIADAGNYLSDCIKHDGTKVNISAPGSA